MKELLREFTDAFGPSGREEAIRATIRKRLRGAADEIRTDALGNLIVRRVGKGKKGAKGWGKRILIAAHMDEVGLMVSHVDARGFIRFRGLGNISARSLAGRRVRFADGTKGVIGIESMDSETKQASVDRMFLDIGATSPAGSLLKAGDVAVVQEPFLDLGERVAAKAMDGRAACAVAVEVLSRLGRTEHEVFVAFTTRSKYGGPGAEAAILGIEPDLGFSIQAAPSEDTPGTQYAGIALGQGPAIMVRGAGMLSDPRIIEWMLRAAKKGKIPYQRVAQGEKPPEAATMQLVGAGVPVGGISIPCRYQDTGSEMVDVSDLENAVRLVLALLRSPIGLEHGAAVRSAGHGKITGMDRY